MPEILLNENSKESFAGFLLNANFFGLRWMAGILFRWMPDFCWMRKFLNAAECKESFWMQDFLWMPQFSTSFNIKESLMIKLNRKMITLKIIWMPKFYMKNNVNHPECSILNFCWMRIFSEIKKCLPPLRMIGCELFMNGKTNASSNNECPYSILPNLPFVNPALSVYWFFQLRQWYF